MVAPNLPPGTTHRDIDRQFGEPETHREVGTAIIDVHASGDIDPETDIKISGSVVADCNPVVRCERVEERDGLAVFSVDVAVEFESQFDTLKENAKLVRKSVSVEPAAEHVEQVQYVDAELGY